MPHRGGIESDRLNFGTDDENISRGSARAQLIAQWLVRHVSSADKLIQISRTVGGQQGVVL